MYRIRVFKDNILINETNLEAFSNSEKEVYCTLYGIQVSVTVLDLLSHPIPNVNVTLAGPATERFSAITKNNGTATFGNVIGGNMQITAFPSGAPNDYQAITVMVNQPTAVQIKLDKYIALGPLLIQTSTLIAIIIILVAILIFAIVELYRRRRVRQEP